MDDEAYGGQTVRGWFAPSSQCAALWCLRRQPCQFGRVAASEGRIHFCFLTERAVSTWSDEEIAEEKQLWKQRAAFEPLRGAHSFVLVVASPQVAPSTPDQHLRAFSDRILELVGWESDRRGARRKNIVTSDFLHLKHPSDGGFYGFRFKRRFLRLRRGRTLVARSPVPRRHCVHGEQYGGT